VQAESIIEILLVGIRLCDVQLGTPEQINSLLDQRIDEIQSEVRPFVPDPFVEYQADEDMQNYEYDNEEFGERE
jgi:hypothetical protein